MGFPAFGVDLTSLTTSPDVDEWFGCDSARGTRAEVVATGDDCECGASAKSSSSASTRAEVANVDIDAKVLPDVVGCACSTSRSSPFDDGSCSTLSTDGCSMTGCVSPAGGISSSTILAVPVIVGGGSSSATTRGSSATCASSTTMATDASVASRGPPIGGSGTSTLVLDSLTGASL